MSVVFPHDPLCLWDGDGCALDVDVVADHSHLLLAAGDLGPARHQDLGRVGGDRSVALNLGVAKVGAHGRASHYQGQVLVLADDLERKRDTKLKSYRDQTTVCNIDRPFSTFLWAIAASK